MQRQDLSADDQSILLAALMDLIQTADPAEMRPIIVSTPQLLTDAADTMIGDALRRARTNNNAQLVRIFEQRLALSRRCREVGIDAAFDQPPAQPRMSPELEQAIQELMANRGACDPHRVVAL